jgi:hypothetical protein
MALINCPECNQQVSSEAKNCPNCGCPLYKAENSGQIRKFVICLIVAVVLCGGGFGWYYIQQERKEIDAAIEANHRYLSSVPPPTSYDDAFNYYLRYKVSDDNWHTFSTAIRLDEVRNVPFSESMIIKDWESKYSKFFSRN